MDQQDSLNNLTCYLQQQVDAIEITKVRYYLNAVKHHFVIESWLSLHLLLQELEEIFADKQQTTENWQKHLSAARAILHYLPKSIELLQQGCEDNPVFFAPLLNDCRAMKRQTFFSLHTLFFPAISTPVLLGSVSSEQQQKYQQGLEGLLAHKNQNLAWTRIKQVLLALVAASQTLAHAEVWRVAEVYVELLRMGRIPFSIAHATILQQINTLLINQQKGNFQEDKEEQAYNLLHNMLYYISLCSAKTAVEKQLHLRFQLPKSLYRLRLPKNLTADMGAHNEQLFSQCYEHAEDVCHDTLSLLATQNWQSAPLVEHLFKLRDLLYSCRQFLLAESLSPYLMADIEQAQQMAIAELLQQLLEAIANEKNKLLRRRRKKKNALANTNNKEQQFLESALASLATLLQHLGSWQESADKNALLASQMIFAELQLLASEAKASLISHLATAANELLQVLYIYEQAPTEKTISVFDAICDCLPDLIASFAAGKQPDKKISHFLQKLTQLKQQVLLNNKANSGAPITTVIEAECSDNEAADKPMLAFANDQQPSKLKPIEDQLVQTFIDQALLTLERLATMIAALTAEQAEKQVDALQQLLRNLEKCARMAGVNIVADLSHQLANLCASREIEQWSELQNELHIGEQQLSFMIETLKTGRFSDTMEPQALVEKSSSSRGKSLEKCLPGNSIDQSTELAKLIELAWSSSADSSAMISNIDECCELITSQQSSSEDRSNRSVYNELQRKLLAVKQCLREQEYRQQALQNAIKSSKCLPAQFFCSYIMKVLADDQIYGIGNAAFHYVLKTHREEVALRVSAAEQRLCYGSKGYTVVSLATLLGKPQRTINNECSLFLLLQVDGQAYAVVLQQHLGNEEVLVKKMEAGLEELPGILGVSQSSEDELLLVLDLPALIKKYQHCKKEERSELATTVLASRKRDIVLLVEDADLATQDLITLLQTNYYRVAHASDAASAWQLLTKLRPKRMIIDLEMSTADGLDLLSKIAAEPYYNDVELIVLSAQEDQQTREQAYALGVNRFITKPYQAETLLAVEDAYNAESMQKVTNLAVNKRGRASC